MIVPKGLKFDPALLEPPQGLEIGEKIVSKYKETRHSNKPNRSVLFVRFTNRLPSIIHLVYQNVQILYNKSIPNRYFLDCTTNIN